MCTTNWPQTRANAQSEHRPVTPGVAGSSPVHSANTQGKRAFAARFFFLPPFAPPRHSGESGGDRAGQVGAERQSILLRERCDRKNEGQRVAAETDEAVMSVEGCGGLVFGIDNQREDPHA